MYNLPEMRANNAAFWRAVSSELARLGVVGAPELPDFTRKPVPGEIEADTLFSQVCGWPLQTIFAGQASIIGVPVYEAPYCDGPRHAGVFIVRREAGYATLADLRGCRFAFNSLHSNSGMNLPRRAVAELSPGERFFAEMTETYSQPLSLERVSDGAADATCVDCVLYAFFARHRPRLAERLRVLTPTASTPAIPFVTAAGTAPDVKAALAEALVRVARAPEWAEARAGLMLCDIVSPEGLDYSTQISFTQEAAALGYPVLQ
jgi:ABC-type phosphate/phosphonate transport system substrate-binding protein